MTNVQNIDAQAVRAELIFRVMDEINKSIVKHGEQSLPLLPNEAARVDFYNHELFWKRINDKEAAEGDRHWDGIILEEVYEALAEGDADKCITELLQSAAMCVKAAADIQMHGLRVE